VAAAPSGQHEASQLVDDGEIRARPNRPVGQLVNSVPRWTITTRGVTVVALHVIETTGGRKK